MKIFQVGKFFALIFSSIFTHLFFSVSYAFQRLYFFIYILIVGKNCYYFISSKKKINRFTCWHYIIPLIELISLGYKFNCLNISLLRCINQRFAFTYLRFSIFFFFLKNRKFFHFFLLSLLNFHFTTIFINI